MAHVNRCITDLTKRQVLKNTLNPPHPVHLYAFTMTEMSSLEPFLMATSVSLLAAALAAVLMSLAPSSTSPTMSTAFWSVTYVKRPSLACSRKAFYR